MRIKRRSAWPQAILATLALILGSVSARGQSANSAEYRSKAKYLSAFPNFVEWPAEAWTTGKGSFLICVFGEFPFGTSLAEATRGAVVNQRRIEVKWIRKVPELRSCQVLFIGQSERKKYGAVLESVRGAGVLTVGETPEFLEAGGMVSFSKRGEILEFDVNLGEANRERLKISSRMLVLARRVINQDEAAKS